MILRIYIQDDLIDLYGDETIELNSSVAAVGDITKINTDYTKTFTVPASDNNNRIFKHYYNADIDNTFDARTKKNCRIEFEGIPFRAGKVRLEKVIVKNGAPSSYTIVFWGNLVNLKSLFKDDMIGGLQGLDFTGLNHQYYYPNVIAGLQSGLFDGNIVYTLLSQRRQFMYNSDPGDNTDTDKLVNIAYNGEDRGVIWNELTPSIRLLAIIEAIEAKYGITFSRDFFGRNEFRELYMWLNNTDGNNYTSQLIDWNSGNATEFGLNLTTNEWVVNSFPSGTLNYKYRLQITPEPGYEAVPYRIVAKDDLGVISTVDAVGNSTTEFISCPTPPFNVTFHVEASATFEYDATLLLRATLVTGTFDRSAQANVSSIVDIFDVAQAIPEIKVIDFMRSLYRMFKLVSIPDSLGNVYVNTIDDYYLAGRVHDLSDWINWSQYEVEHSLLHPAITFKFLEPTTILNIEFKKRTGAAYGDEQAKFEDENGEPLDGETLETDAPYEVIIFERLTDGVSGARTAIQYGLSLDDKLDPVKPKGVIHYANKVSLASSPISLINQTGDTVQISGLVNTPAHTLGFDSPQFSILWGKEFSTWDGAEISGTLFSNYWQKYVESIFNVKRRNFKFKAVLPVALLTAINLNDVVLIKDTYYRISDFTVNLINREASLNLMNTFETNFGIFAPSQDRVLLTATEQSYGVYVSNGEVMNIAKEDIGAGTGWATVTHDGNNIIIAVTANATTDPRSLYINVDNGAGKSFQILLTQDVAG